RYVGTTAIGEFIREDLGPIRSVLFRLSGAQPYPDFKSFDSPGWRLMTAILRRFLAELAPVPVLIVPIPTYEFYLLGLNPTYQKFFAMLEDKKCGVHVLDVSTPLVDLPWRTRCKLCFKTGGHFTPFGHETVARLIADCIRERKLLPVSSEIATAAAPPR